MSRRLFTLIVIVLPFIANAQSDPTKYAAEITVADLKENLSIIASDAMEGRLTGSRGQAMAAAFIAYQFDKAGLKGLHKGEFFQPYNLYSYQQKKVVVKNAAKTFSNDDIAYYSSISTGGEKTLDVVFAGRGTDEEISQVQVRNKMVLIWASEISFASISATIKKLSALGAFGIMVYFNVSDAERNEFLEGVHGMMAEGKMSLTPVRPDAEPRLLFVNKSLVESVMSTTFDKLLKSVESKKDALRKLKPGKLTVDIEVEEHIVKTGNVAGFLEGTDKKDEVVVITAHYDHIGKNPEGSQDMVNNGADDDGSGTVAVLQLAKAFSEAKKAGAGPRRSMLFMTVSGEELGLFGSQYYTDDTAQLSV